MVASKNTRNYLTHYNSKLEQKSVSRDKLFRLNQILIFMIQYCLLLELGVTPDKCYYLINKNPNYQYLIELGKFDF